MTGAFFYNFSFEEVRETPVLLALRFLLVVERLHHLIDTKSRRTLARRKLSQRHQEFL
jgi:hypothetical protein